MAARVDLSAWPEGARQVVARMIHATADESFATSARVGPTGRWTPRWRPSAAGSRWSATPGW